MKEEETPREEETPVAGEDPKTVEEAFVAEYFALKRENEALREKVAKLARLVEEASESEEACLGALNAIDLTTAEDGVIKARHPWFYRGDDGYYEVRKYLTHKEPDSGNAD